VVVEGQKRFSRGNGDLTGFAPVVAVLHSPRRWGAVCVIVAVALVAVGCSEIRYKTSAEPNIDVLEESLQIGKSTQADVLAVLGKPNGEGVTMLPIDAKARKMWSYYYEEGTVKVRDGGGIDADMRRTFLFIYFDDDSYDGYMWFSSLRE
jgi:hypothetical protein